MSRKEPHIAVISINRDKYSETFIQNAFDCLPCKKSLLYGGYLPTHFTTDWRVEGKEIPVVKPPFWKMKPDSIQAQRVLNLQNWLKTERVDFILANYGPSGVALLPVIQAMQLPMIVHFHGYDAYRDDILGSYGKHYLEMFAAAKAIVAVSVDMTRQLNSLGAPSEKLHTYIYGVDAAVFQRKELPGGPVIFGFVGRFVEKKSPMLLIQAFARVHAQVPDARLRCVGDGELLAACQKLAADLGISAAVDFLGALPSVDVATFLGECHVVLLPSQRSASGDSEGTPLVLLEAAMTGRAVVATHHGGISDVVFDGKTGLLVPQGDLEGFVEAMLTLATLPDLRMEFGKNAAAHAELEFSASIYHHKLWHLIQDLV
jgi:colanic acid/amylovoran biosynthesis glycosyltransferase